MNKLIRIVLPLAVCMAGCATTPEIVGVWKVQSPHNLVGVDTVEIFKDGTVLATSIEDDASFLLNWSKSEGVAGICPK